MLQYSGSQPYWRSEALQEQEARQLREAWSDRPCPHPAFDRLCYGGVHEGYVCLPCGWEFTGEERDQVLARRNQDEKAESL